MTTQRIPIPGTSLALDGQEVQTSQGAAIREVTSIGDPSVNAAIAAVRALIAAYEDALEEEEAAVIAVILAS